jgi:signal transduction histidine kinase
MKTSIGHLRLRTQLFIAALVVICGLTGALLLIVRHAMRAEIASQVQQSTSASLRAFESVQDEHELQSSRSAAMVAELPTLKALMTTQHAVTIQDASEPFWKLAGSDLFLLANTEGKILGFHVAKPGWITAVAERDLGQSLDRGERTAWWYADGQLYWVFLRPIEAGMEKEERQLGILAVGYQIDSKLAEQLAVVAGSQIALSANDRIIASTLPAGDEGELERKLVRHELQSGAATREIVLGIDSYQVASVLIHGGPSTPVTCYVLMSLRPATAFMQRLNRIIFAVGLSAVFLASILLSFLSRTITRPLDNLVAGVRALAKGDYGYSITPRGSSEMAELGEAFLKMRSELLASQQRELATERIAALGRAASSISHDLRHYLAAVVANAEFLYEADRLKLDRDEIYDEIKTASNQMIDLLDSLRELSRGEGAISRVPASVDQTIRQAVDAVLASPELRNRTISINTSGAMDGVFDPRKIQRAFFNLLLNACEATSGRDGRIQIEIAESHGSFDVRIADNGIGIPECIRGTLFDPFVSSGKPNGTGLGLAIVNKIIHDHDGSIRIEKTSETGTVFLVKLPRSPRDASQQQPENIAS